MNAAATPQAALEVDRVTLALGGREILNDTSFTVATANSSACSGRTARARPR